MTKLDVAIIGGGLAGNLLARQLRRALPDLHIGIFEKNTTTTFKVGESMVEIASNYLIRRLGLSTYLYNNQLPKNGLRFFFDSPQKDVVLPQMSEIGGLAFPYHPGFQLDRARFEADLHTMNVKDGIAVHLGAKVENLQIDNHQEDFSQHKFQVTSAAGTQVHCSRWLIDASGRSSVLAKKLGLRVPEHSHKIFTVWGRFRGVTDWESLGPEDFKKRIRYTSRMLSTNHFCYPGYWIWFIPLGNGITSIGVVGEPLALQNGGLRSKEGFLSFLQSHRAVASLLESSEMIDIGTCLNPTYNTSQYFSEQRWGLTGEAAVFTDPFYSPGSDFIALENDFLTNLITLDIQGASSKDLLIISDLYNQYMSFRCESSMLLYRGLYQILGSFEILKLKWYFDFSLYYQWWLSQYLQDLHLDESFLHSQLENRPVVLNTLKNFASFFRKIESHLKEKGQYYRLNQGMFSHSFENIDFTEQVGLPQRGYDQLKQLTNILNNVRSRGLLLLDEKDNEHLHQALPLSQLTSSQPFI